MKDILAKFRTALVAITFAEANEHETARQILRDQSRPRPAVRPATPGCGKTAVARA